MNRLERRKRLLPVILAAIILPLYTVFTVPFETYCNNFAELDFAFVEIIPVSLVFVLILSLLIGFVLFFLPKKLFYAFYGITLGISIMCYLQVNLFNQYEDTSLPLDSFKGICEKSILTNLTIWILVVAIFAIGFLIFGKKQLLKTIGISLSAFLLATQGTSFLSEVFSNPKVLSSWEQRYDEKNYMITTDGLNTFSNQNNVFVFCLDRLDEYFCEEAYERNQDVFSAFSDFRWYKNCTSRYGHTYPSVVYMVTGIDHKQEEDRENYFERAFNDSQFLHILKEANYDIRFYSEPYYSYQSGCSFNGLIENISEAQNKSIDSKLMLTYHLSKIALYKASPFYFRTNYYFRNLSTQTITDHIKEGTVYSSDVETIMKQLKNTKSEVTDHKNFSFIHTEGLHSLPETEWYLEDSVTIQKKDSILYENVNLVEYYLNKMKELGIYDNATIIITGDHGKVRSDYEPLSESNLTALFIKPSQKADGILNSQEELCHSDLHDIILKSEGISEGDVFGKSETRNFFWDTKDMTRYTYEIKSNARNFENWILSEQKTLYSDAMS